MLAVPGPEAARLVAEYWQSVEHRVAGQRKLAAYLSIQLSGNEGSLDMYQIQQRDVPEQLMLTEQRNVRPEDLPVWIPAAMTRLIADAAAIGGFVAPPFAVFHGEVNEDSDGPVEVCLPIDPARSAEVTGPNRVEPARREGYTTITKAEVQYPQILSAYEAVYQWLGRNRRTPTGPPRAVYFADFPAASPEDPVCDLAVPMD